MPLGECRTLNSAEQTSLFAKQILSRLIAFGLLVKLPKLRITLLAQPPTEMHCRWLEEWGRFWLTGSQKASDMLRYLTLMFLDLLTFITAGTAMILPFYSDIMG